MEKARLWRLILLHNTAGYSGAYAGACVCAAGHHSKARRIARPPNVFSGNDAQAQRAFIQGQSDGKSGAADVEEDDGAGSLPGSPASPGSPGTPEALRDDPLHFSLTGALASMPQALRGATAEPAERVWVTLLCTALLESMENCYIVNGVASKEMEEEEVTMVDLAEEWLAGVASRDAAVAAALPGARVRRGAP
jgi:hypothetical protein